MGRRPDPEKREPVMIRLRPASWRAIERVRSDDGTPATSRAAAVKLLLERWQGQCKHPTRYRDQGTCTQCGRDFATREGATA